jgi:predicted  nucleic acid-binding Zn-ribbon protein
MAPDLKLVIQLQDLDGRIKELQHEISALPKQLAAIEKTLDSHVRKLEADRAALAANQRERKKLEADIQLREQKISKLKDQMMEAKTNEQYRAFQNEIEYCQNEIRKCEDRILDLMAESEPLEQNVKTAEAALKDERKKVDEEKQRVRKCTTEDEAQLSEFQAQRTTIVKNVPPRIYSSYERIRAKRRGVAVAEAIDDGRCSACHLALRPQFFQDLKSSDQVMFCESCGRILYYNPPADVEAEMTSQPGPGANSLHPGL